MKDQHAPLDGIQPGVSACTASCGPGACDMTKHQRWPCKTWPLPHHQYPGREAQCTKMFVYCCQVPNDPFLESSYMHSLSLQEGWRLITCHDPYKGLFFPEHLRQEALAMCLEEIPGSLVCDSLQQEITDFPAMQRQLQSSPQGVVQSNSLESFLGSSGPVQVSVM